MLPINNSDTAWLIVSDYNQENGKYYKELREDILDPDVDHWVYDVHIEFNYNYGMEGDTCGSLVGTGSYHDDDLTATVGDFYISCGGGDFRVGSAGLDMGALVGGNWNGYDANQQF
jgi:hypothetical protein